MHEYNRRHGLAKSLKCDYRLQIGQVKSHVELNLCFKLLLARELYVIH